MVDIGKRLRELRKAKGLSQNDLEDRCGLSRCHISLIENGHSTPTLQVLERWAKGLDVELYELFFVGQGQAEATALPGKIPVGAQERTLLELFGQIPIEDRALLISLASDMIKRKGNRG